MAAWPKRLASLGSSGVAARRCCNLGLLASKIQGKLLVVIMLRSCCEAARCKRLAPFRAAGFCCTAAAWALPDAELFARQRRQFLVDGQAVPDETMADMRGPPCAVFRRAVLRPRHGSRTTALLTRAVPP